MVPNPGGLLSDNWELSLDVTPEYQTDVQGQAWCPDANPKDAAGQPKPRVALSSPKYGTFNRIHCVMPVLAEVSKRKIVTVSGQVIASQGFGYREATGAVLIPLTLP